MPNLEKDIQIDPNALDVEWMRQPEIYLKYAEESAKAQSEADRAKDKLEVVEAEVDAEVRMQYSDTKKPTETQIAGIVLTNQRVILAKESLIQAKERASLLSSAVKAFDQRKNALENLVRLWAGSYFAGPSVPRELSKEFLEKSVGDRATSISKERMKDVTMPPPKSRRTK